MGTPNTDTSWTSGNVIERAKRMTADDHIEAASVLLTYDVQGANVEQRTAKAHVHALLAIAMKK